MICSLISHHIGNNIIGWKYTRLWDAVTLTERGRVHTHIHVQYKMTTD